MNCSTEPGIRELTEQEVKDYFTNGWVKLPKYVNPDYARELHQRGLERMGFDGATPPNEAEAAAVLSTKAMWQQLRAVSQEDPAFRAVAMDPQMGKNVQRLLRRDVGVRYWVDVLASKFPQAWGRGDGPTYWHQDLPGFPIDRSGSVACWIALDSVTPEHGSMSFLNGSHRSETFGRIQAFEKATSIFDTFSWLREEYQQSEPLSYEPGDATLHHCQVVHGASANLASSPRWSYICTYLAADARYTGGNSPGTAGLGLVENEVIDHPDFPLVWPPE